MKYLWEVLKLLPVKAIALIALALAGISIYHVYAGEVRTNREGLADTTAKVEAQEKTQQEVNRSLEKIADGQERRIQFIEQQMMKAAGVPSQPSEAGATGP